LWESRNALNFLSHVLLFSVIEPGPHRSVRSGKQQNAIEHSVLVLCRRGYTRSHSEHGS